MPSVLTSFHSGPAGQPSSLAMSSPQPELPARVVDWTHHDVRHWLENKLSTRFPGQAFGDMLTTVETVCYVM